MPLNEVYRLVIPYTNGAVWIVQVTSIRLGTDVVPSPQSQSSALTDALKNSVLGKNPCFTTAYISAYNCSAGSHSKPNPNTA
jgi:hypothetical protein